METTDTIKTVYPKTKVTYILYIYIYVCVCVYLLYKYWNRSEVFSSFHSD